MATFVMLSKDPAEEAASVEPSVLSWKKIEDALDTIQKDAAAEAAQQKETKESIEEMERLQREMDEQMKRRPGLGFKP